MIVIVDKKLIEAYELRIKLLKINHLPIIISEKNVNDYRVSLNNVEALRKFIEGCEVYNI